MRAERRAARHIPLRQAVDEVTSAPAGSSDEARDSVAERIATVGERLLEECGGEAPPGFEQFAGELQPIVAAERFGNRQLDEVLAAWLRWGRRWGRQRQPAR